MGTHAARLEPWRGSPGIVRRAGGEIRGIVVDAEAGHPIEGAQVYGEKTKRGALTDSSGHFRITEVPPVR